MFQKILLVIACVVSIACSVGQSQPPLPAVESVDLQRFMGAWHVIGFIPLYPEKDAYNGIERYRLDEDGQIHTTYRFREGSFDGELKTYHPTATVVEGSNNALWEMQFLWPFNAEYRIAYLSKDYQTVIVARTARDYVWLMSRSPNMTDSDYQHYKKKIADMGYDLTDFKRQPQRWPESRARPKLND
jgi:apolipoprotein D and lipocalin family protein